MTAGGSRSHQPRAGFVEWQRRSRERMAQLGKLWTLYRLAEQRRDLELFGAAIEARDQAVAIMRELGLPEADVALFVKELGPLEQQRQARTKGD